MPDMPRTVGIRRDAAIRSFGKCPPADELVLGRWTWGENQKIHLTVGLEIEIFWGGCDCLLWTERLAGVDPNTGRSCIWRMARLLSNGGIEMIGSVSGPNPTPLLYGAHDVLMPMSQTVPVVSKECLGLSQEVSECMHDMCRASIANAAVETLASAVASPRSPKRILKPGRFQRHEKSSGIAGNAVISHFSWCVSGTLVLPLAWHIPESLITCSMAGMQVGPSCASFCPRLFYVLRKLCWISFVGRLPRFLPSAAPCQRTVLPHMIMGFMSSNAILVCRQRQDAALNLHQALAIHRSQMSIGCRRRAHACVVH